MPPKILDMEPQTRLHSTEPTPAVWSLGSLALTPDRRTELKEQERIAEAIRPGVQVLAERLGLPIEQMEDYCRNLGGEVHKYLDSALELSAPE